ncbi:MAG: single-stranded-DNA-specific exonuclease RecJ [Clostridia bacterium]
MLRFIPRDAHEMDERAAAALRPYAGVMARLLYARGVTDASQAERFLHPSLSQLHDPFLMSGMREAVSLLERACAEKLPTVIYGDYDVDGVCASALLTLALRRYGVNAATHVPLREEGYGLSAAAVRELAQSYKLLITVDLGITNHEEVRLAQQLGMTVIVTDHHALALENSPADAVINPLLGEYPFRRLCGTGVALKLAQALLGVAACEEYLDLAALATVADIVPLRGENRVLVALGLPKIAARSRAGMRALLEVSGGGDEVSAETLGFRLGPRLNAAGRLGDASKGVRLMLTQDAKEADELAQELDRLNTERKTAEMCLVKDAELAALSHDFIGEKALIVKGEGWHLGVIGLAAGRLCQHYDCPVCVLSEQDGLLHGSLRSIPGVNIHRCLQECDELLLRYGGHEQAAGVTLACENYSAFCERLQGAVAKADAACFVPAKQYDAELTLDACTGALLDELEQLAPFGCENPSPLLLTRNAEVEERRAVGVDGAHLKISFRQNQCVMGGIAFSMGREATALPDRVDVLFSLGRNSFRGVTSLQMEVKAMRPLREAQKQAIVQHTAACEQNELTEGLLEAFALKAGKTLADTEKIPMIAEKTEALQEASWQALQTALQANERGLLLVSRTRESALRAFELAQLEMAAHCITDPRGFHTLLTAPLLCAANGHWRQIWLLDGEICEGEAALWQAACVQAQVIALPRSTELAALAAELDAGDECLRTLYKALRANAFRTLHQAAQAASLTDVQARVGMHAFASLGLISFAESPFAYHLCKAEKCRLEDSPLLSALRALC